MFDTMTFTKVIGGFCGTLLVFLLGGWVAETVYHVGGESHGEGESHAAYVIEVEESGEGGGEEEEADFETLWASADAGSGEKVFGKCRACHNLDGSNAVGPYLNGVVGRDVGSVDGFSYSGALSEAADVWTPENLYNFLENPSGWAPGTSMGYAGLKSQDDRVNLIAYLEGTGG